MNKTNKKKNKNSEVSEKKNTFTSQSLGANRQNQYQFATSLTIPLYLFVQNLANDQCLELHEIYHLHQDQIMIMQNSLAKGCI